jgi:hypothetical protein
MYQLSTEKLHVTVRVETLTGHNLSQYINLLICYISCPYDILLISYALNISNYVQNIESISVSCEGGHFSFHLPVWA